MCNGALTSHSRPAVPPSTLLSCPQAKPQATPGPHALPLAGALLFAGRGFAVNSSSARRICCRWDSCSLRAWGRGGGSKGRRGLFVPLPGRYLNAHSF